MSGLLLRAAGLAGIYLLVMTSLDPGDVIVGAALGMTIAMALRPHRMNRSFAGSSGADRMGGCFRRDAHRDRSGDDRR